MRFSDSTGLESLFGICFGFIGTESLLLFAIANGGDSRGSVVESAKILKNAAVLPSSNATDQKMKPCDGREEESEAS